MLFCLFLSCALHLRRRLHTLAAVTWVPFNRHCWRWLQRRIPESCPCVIWEAG